jgi:hypothetical protein
VSAPFTFCQVCIFILPSYLNMGGARTTSHDESKHNSTLMPPTSKESFQSPKHESQHEPKASFSSLPLELRYKIWLLTLQPRVLYLHIHQRIEPPPYDGDDFIDGPRKTVSVSFTAQVAMLPLLPSEVFEKYANYVAPDPTTLDVDRSNEKIYDLHYANVVATRPLSIKNSRGPVALEVCRESREVAMKRYELAFAGTNRALEPTEEQEWNKKGFSEKRIWVDFERDIIFIDAIWRDRKYSKCAPHNPLGLLRRYAREDAKKIRRLALGTSLNFGWGGGQLIHNLRGSHIPMGGGAPVWQRRWEWFWGLDSVVELFVDDHFKSQGEQHESGYLNGAKEEEWIAKAIAERMREGRKGCPEWIAEVPLVKVVRGSAWAAYVE